MTQQAPAEPLPIAKRPAAWRTPMDDFHCRNGTQFIESNGWRLPAEYRNGPQEVEAARSAVGLCDISAFAKFRVRGPAARGWLERVAGEGSARPASAVAIPGNPRLTACWLTPDHGLVLADTTDTTTVKARIDGLGTLDGAASPGEAADRPADWHDVTCGLAGFHLLGPAAGPFMRQLTAVDIGTRSFPPGHCLETNCAGIHATLVHDAIYSLAALRIYVAWDMGEYLWDTLLAHGRRFGLVPIGMNAWGQALGGERP